MTTSRLLCDLPPQVEAGGYVYVIAFSNGTVKVGKTIDPAGRFAAHASASSAFDITIRNWWITDAHEAYASTEQAAIAAAKALAADGGRRTRREYFHGVDFQQLITTCQEINLADPLVPVADLSAPARISDDIPDESLAEHVGSALSDATPWLPLPIEQPVSASDRRKAIGQLLAHGRRRMGLNQTQFADAVSLSLSTVSRWERGLELSPRLTVARRYFDGADVHMATATVALGLSTIGRVAADPRRY